MATPDNERLIASFRKVLGRDISPVFAHPDDINAVIDLHFTNEQALAVSLQKACDNLPTLEGGREFESEADANTLKKALIGWTTLEEVEKCTLPEMAYRH